MLGVEVFFVVSRIIMRSPHLFSLVTRYRHLFTTKTSGRGINIPLREKKIWISGVPQSSIYPFTYLRLFPLCSSSSTATTSSTAYRRDREGEDFENRHPPPHITHSKPHQRHTASCFGFNGSSGFLVGNPTLVGHTLPNNLLWNDIFTPKPKFESIIVYESK